MPLSSGSWKRRCAMIEAELRHALARDELSLHYHPKVDLRSGVVVGMEALLRWRHPQMGMVSPARSIPVAEETGMLVAIGRWVLRNACAQNMAWQRAGPVPLRVAINLSARQFRDPGLGGEVAAALADGGLAAQYLELELTESLMMHNVDEAVAVVAGLKRLGSTLSIDDFGTGYSSVAYLKLFPVDYLKIDQSFVREMLTEPRVAAIVRSVIALGQSLGFQIVAEGVETAAQLAYLRRYQCDEMQGYFFSKPLPPDQFAVLLRAQTAEEAFDLLALNQVQVVISDQRMPGMHGTEFLSRVKKLCPDTIRIILSGYTELDSVLNAINCGEIFRFYIKPWDGHALRENIREAFQDHALIHGRSAALPEQAPEPSC